MRKARRIANWRTLGESVILWKSDRVSKHADITRYGNRNSGFRRQAWSAIRCRCLPKETTATLMKTQQSQRISNSLSPNLFQNNSFDNNVFFARNSPDEITSALPSEAREVEHRTKRYPGNSSLSLRHNTSNCARYERYLVNALSKPHNYHTLSSEKQQTLVDLAKSESSDADRTFARFFSVFHFFIPHFFLLKYSIFFTDQLTGHFIVGPNDIGYLVVVLIREERPLN